jgi:hypothetical protein
MSPWLRKQIAQARRKIVQQGLTIEVIDEIRWRVCAPDGASLFYFPLEERWLKDKEWGNGVLALTAALIPDLVSHTAEVIILGARRSRDRV